MQRTRRGWWLLLVGIMSLTVGGVGSASAAAGGVAHTGLLARQATPALDPADILATRCAGCHSPLPDGGYSRISQIRKTPEGWEMTLFRMVNVHGATLSDDEAQVLIKHLSEEQGLAPAETQRFRYILERTPNVQEDVPEEGDLSSMCVRCHSYARVGLERRDTAEWAKLANFHLGQWPTTEYHASSRDRRWWELVSTETVALLGQRFPFITQEWLAWSEQPKASLEGTWQVVTRRTGGPTYAGQARVVQAEPDRYSAEYDLASPDGQTLAGGTDGFVYTGYEWRGAGMLGPDEIREVYALAEDGNSLSGRWFLADHDEVGGTLQAVREGAGPRVLALSQAFLRAGETADITIWGVDLSGPVDFGPGVSTSVISESPDIVVVQAQAAPDAPPGPRQATVGDVVVPSFVVYQQVDSVRVEPPFAIARVGGAGGQVPPVTAQFEAVAYLNGPDGQPETADDVRIGVMPARWSVVPFNEVAEQLRDVDFAGTIDPTQGVFLPAAAGPNPARPFSTNNAGDLTVKATISDAGRSLTGSGHLIVTVQRWNDPPIR